MKNTFRRIYPVLFLYVLNSTLFGFPIQAGAPVAPELKANGVIGYYQGGSVSITAPLNAQIRYRINGQSWRTSPSPLRITLYSSLDNIDYLAFNTEGESQTQTFSAQTLKETTPYVITNFIASAEQEKCVAMSSDFVAGSAVKLKAVGTERTERDELIIDQLSLIWRIEENNSNRRLIGANGSYLSVGSGTELKFQTNTFNWIWEEERNAYEYTAGSSVRTPMYASGSPGGFKAYAIGNWGKSGYGLRSARYPVELIRLTGSMHDSQVNYFFSLPTLKAIDLSEATLPDDKTLEATANPNCLVFTRSTQGLVRNEICAGICRNLVLTDNAPFGTLSDFTAEEASYSRMAWQDGGWETIKLPFAVAEAYMPADYIFDEFTGLSPNGDAAHFTQVRELKANTPYLMKYAGSTPAAIQRELTFRVMNVEVKSAPVASAFKGVYTQTNTKDKYILGEDKDGNIVFGKGTAASYVTPFHAYLDINDNNTGFKIVHKPAVPASATSGEEDLWKCFSPGNGIIHIICDTGKTIEVRSIDGRRLLRKDIGPGETALPGFEPGVYLINDRKIIIN